MTCSEPFSIHQLSAKDIALTEELLAVFGEAFEEVDTYSSSRPSAASRRPATTCRRRRCRLIGAEAPGCS